MSIGNDVRSSIDMIESAIRDGDLKGVGQATVEALRIIAAALDKLESKVDKMY